MMGIRQNAQSPLFYSSIGQVWDHSPFSEHRHDRLRDSDLLRRLFETVVAHCIAAGLASAQRFAADASIIQADANRQNSSPQAKWTPKEINAAQASRAVSMNSAMLPSSSNRRSILPRAPSTPP